MEESGRQVRSTGWAPQTACDGGFRASGATWVQLLGAGGLVGLRGERVHCRWRSSVSPQCLEFRAAGK